MKNNRDRKVQEEAKWFCNRKTSYPHPCHVHKPTMEELKSLSFSDFVRQVVLKKGRYGTYDSDIDDDSDNDKNMKTRQAKATSEYDDLINLLQNPPVQYKQGMAKIRFPKEFINRNNQSLSSSTTTTTTTTTTSTVASTANNNASNNEKQNDTIDNDDDNNNNGKTVVENWQERNNTYDDERIELGQMIIPSPIEQNIRGIGGIYEYTFFDQPSITVADFEKKANEYFQKQVGKRYQFKPVNNDNNKNNNNNNNENENDIDVDENEESNNEIIDLLERKLWKRLGPTMPPPMYGADMEGTLFRPKDDCCGWNVSRLSSCLQLLFCDHPPPEDDDDDNNNDESDDASKKNTKNRKRRRMGGGGGRMMGTNNAPSGGPTGDGGIPGVTTPYLYFGMWASVFCAHTEDMNLLSINYLHAGAPKVWYAIAPGEDSKRLEQLCEGHYHQAKTECSEYLRHKRSLISPHILKKAGIPFTKTIQYPGEAVITFPGGYHQGFNIGFNIAEATNFAVPEWIPYGKLANVCLCRPDSVRIDMYRFERLIQRYEKQRYDQQKRYNKRRNMSSWKEWAIEEARKKKKQQQLEEEDDDDDEIEQETEEEEEEEEETAATTKRGSPSRKRNQKGGKKVTNKKSDINGKKIKEGNNDKPSKPKQFWVEVMKPISANSAGIRNNNKKRKKKNDTKTTTTTSKRRSKRRSSKNDNNDDTENNNNTEIWHLAKPITRKILRPSTKVLCIVPMAVHIAIDDKDNDNDDDDDDDEQCFAGVVTEFTDDYVRVHLDGLPKKDDVWMSIQSPKLFLDGGKWDGQDEDSLLPARHYWVHEDSTRHCV